LVKLWCAIQLFEGTILKSDPLPAIPKIFVEEISQDLAEISHGWEEKYSCTKAASRYKAKLTMKTSRLSEDKLINLKNEPKI